MTKCTGITLGQLLDVCPTCCKLDPGLAIIVEGYNDKGKAV